MNNLISKSITVGILTYNDGENLKKLLSSISRQTRFPLEIIVIDNHGNLATGDITDKFSTLNFNFYKNNSNSIPSARNIIIDKCQTEYILFVDSDCTVASNWVESFDEEICKKRIDFGVGQVFTPSDLNLFGRSVGILEKPGVRLNGDEVIGAPTCNFIGKKKIMSKLRFNENLLVAEDEDFVNRVIFSKKKIHFVNDAIVYHYHRNKIGDFILWRLRDSKSRLIHLNNCLANNTKSANLGSFKFYWKIVFSFFLLISIFILSYFYPILLLQFPLIYIILFLRNFSKFSSKFLVLEIIIGTFLILFDKLITIISTPLYSYLMRGRLSDFN